MNDATKTRVRLWAFDPVCTRCGRRGCTPANCNWPALEKNIMLARYLARLEELLAEAEADGIVLRVAPDENLVMECEAWRHPKGPPAKRSFPVVPRRAVPDKPKKGIK